MARNHRQSMHQSRVASVVSLLRKSPGRPWTVLEMARAAEISESQLRKDFVIATGQSPTRYLKLLRMTVALDLLLTTTRSVKDVAAGVGLPDVSHFVRDFRARYGAAPSALRSYAGLSKPSVAFDPPPVEDVSDSANK